MRRSCSAASTARLAAASSSARRISSSVSCFAGSFAAGAFFAVVVAAAVPALAGDLTAGFVAGFAVVPSFDAGCVAGFADGAVGLEEAGFDVPDAAADFGAEVDDLLAILAAGFAGVDI